MSDIDPRMRLVSEEPLNAETSLGAHGGVLTPNSLHYYRNHFPFPADGWTITIGGRVRKPFELWPAHLANLHSRSILVTMECAGNGRSGFSPKAEGEEWEYGAVSTAEWTGVPLASVLDMAGLEPDVIEIVIEGADHGHVEAAGGKIAYTRSLPLAKALDPDLILAHAMNGEEIAQAHGQSCRLIVPGWYGTASVKWVSRIEAVAEPFRGFYQADRYVMPTPDGSSVPLGVMRVRSHITTPEPGGQFTPDGQGMIRGFAWSGEAPIVRVEVSTDGGATWAEAHLASREERYAWRRWEYLWDTGMGPRETTLMSRAFDANGNTQPEDAEWNQLGYANNAIKRVPVKILRSHEP